MIWLKVSLTCLSRIFSRSVFWVLSDQFPGRPVDPTDGERPREEWLGQLPTDAGGDQETRHGARWPSTRFGSEIRDGRVNGVIRMK